MKQCYETKIALLYHYYHATVVPLWYHSGACLWTGLRVVWLRVYMDICIYITEILLYFVTKAPCSARGAPRGGQWPATQATEAQGGCCCSEARKLFEFVPSSNCKPFGAPR